MDPLSDKVCTRQPVLKSRLRHVPNRWIFIASLLINSNAYALAILDCNGTTRAAKDVEAISKNDVKIDVVDKQGQLVSNQEVTLTNVNDGTVVKTVAKNGVAEFGNIPDGTWMLSTPANSTFFSTIIIADAVTPLIAGSAVVATGGTVVGGGAIVATTGDSLLGGNNKDTPEVLPPVEPTPVPPSVDDCPICDPDDEAPELPDFFDDDELSPES